MSRRPAARQERLSMMPSITVAFIWLMAVMHGSLERPMLQCNWCHLSVQVLELLWEVTQEAEEVEERGAEERDSAAAVERDSSVVTGQRGQQNEEEKQPD